MEQGRLVSTWESLIKNADQEAEIHTLHKYDHTTPTEIPDFINQAAPTKITPSRRQTPTREASLTVFFPDAQIPFHDPRALSAAHLVVRELQPDNVVMLGDMLDFPSLSRFESRPEWNGGVQDALDQTHRMLAQVRADVPNARIHYLPGNHEARLQKSILKNNAELLGIKRANAEKELGVLSLEFLLRMNELEVSMEGQYPSGRLWLEDHLAVIHGTSSNARGSTSSRYLNDDPHTSIVHGHSHRAEIQWKTTNTRGGYIQRFAMSPGTLASITGEVPSFWSTIDEQGDVVNRAENWQQAVGIVAHNKHSANPSLAMIQGGVLTIHDKRYQL
jgi:UDP-2,3-diacylglucosamine pyrophosphatase LpxH